MASELDTDTALQPEGGRWRATITDRWGIPGGPNGGYIAAILTRALAEESPVGDPLTMTTHYLARPQVGDAEVAVSHLREGRSHATLEARLVQGGEPVAVALATFGRRREGEPEQLRGGMPDVPSPAEAEPPPRVPVPGITLRDRLDHLQAVDPPAAGGWTRLKDGRPVDDVAVALFMDCWPPPVLLETGPGAIVPTVELTIHWRGRPGDGWHLALFSSRFLTGGYIEEDGELWSEDGRLVAQSRQLARFMPPRDAKPTVLSPSG